MGKVLLIPMALVLVIANGSSAQPSKRQDLPMFMGHKITILSPELDPDGLDAKGPASVCVDLLPQMQCYEAPKGFGRFPKVEIVRLQKDAPAILFSVASDGVSGWQVHFALLRPGTGKDLYDLLVADATVSNQNQHVFWSDSTLSESPIFVTADYVWGTDEGHYGEHRYIISAYVRRPSWLLEGRYYSLEDRYMTVRRYDLEAGADILAAEKPEVLARLRRVKAESGTEQRVPR